MYGSKNYHVYMVRCADGSYYIGMTNDCQRRVDEHRNGIDPKCYTYSRRPVELVYTALFTDVWGGDFLGKTHQAVE